MDLNKIKGSIEFKQYTRFNNPIMRIANKLASFYTPIHTAFLAKFGVVKDQWQTENLTMNAGFAVFSGLAGNTGSQTAFSYLAVGTSSTAVSASQTTLGAEITTNGLARAAATVSRVTTTQTNDTLQLVKTWTSSGTHSVEEIGYFNASSAGVMGGRSLTGTKSIANGETLAATYKIKFA